MDYEKKYNEALEKARKELKQDLHESGVWAIQRIFPELKESEDERIRKELIDAFAAYDVESSWNGIPVSSVLSWLERQKEQKPAECSDALEIDTIRDWSMRFAPDIREEIVATAYHFYNLRSK